MITWLLKPSSIGCLSYMSSKMFLTLRNCFSASSRVCGTAESRGIWRSILSKNVASERRVSECFLHSSRMVSNSNWRSDNLVLSRE